MPNKTQKAVDWALKQSFEDDVGENVKVKSDPHLLVDFVRRFFNENQIDYDTFDYNDLKPYL